MDGVERQDGGEEGNVSTDRGGLVCYINEGVEL